MTYKDTMLTSTIRHLSHCCLLAIVIITFEYASGVFRWTDNNNKIDIDPWLTYGYVGATILYLLRFLTFLSLPQVLFNFIGLIIYNAFPEKVVLKGSPLLAPFICIRVVTRGDYPQLVKTNVQRNLTKCTEAGLENFQIEVVTDKPINITPHRRIREITVPTNYRTSTGALFKARALQYCLEETVNELADHDWIVHLDEETLLTENSVRGILNFVLDGKHQFGQGLITYANENVVNWITTLADSFRVSDDMGKLRLQFTMFHRPLFSMKGSYVVTQMGAEKQVSFDNGLDGSIAEDCFFAMKAYTQAKKVVAGYSSSSPLKSNTITLTPALGVLLLLTIFILPRMGSGPLWRLTMDTQKNICSEHWWNLLLYIQNYRNTEVLACLDHTWYLAVDMQLFWISPFILYPLAKKPKVGIFILMILGIASIIAPAIVTIQNEYSGGLFNPNRLTSLVDTLSNYYVRTYVRAAPWIMGLYTGYKIRSTGNLPGINFVRFGWILTSVAALFIFLTYRIFQTDDYKFNVYWEGFYAGFSRCIWGFGICWIIYSSALGYGGFINNFLSCSIFLPFNRISYSVYLVHNLIQMMKINAARTSEYFSDLHMINIFFSDVVESVLVGFFFCVLFESPFLILNKMILLKMRRSNRMKNDCDHSQQTMAQIVLTTIRA